MGRARELEREPESERETLRAEVYACVDVFCVHPHAQPCCWWLGNDCRRRCSSRFFFAFSETQTHVSFTNRWLVYIWCVSVQFFLRILLGGNCFSVTVIDFPSFSSLTFESRQRKKESIFVLFKIAEDTFHQFM